MLRSRLFTATALFAAIAWPANASDLRAGRAATVITPPAGMPMAGYYYVRLNEGVHDDLHAKAIVIEKDGVKAALVALDLVGVPRSITAPAREQIAKTTRIPIENVMISATHSHTGPEMGGRLKGVDAKTEKLAQDYYALLIRRIVEAVQRADADLQPVRIRTTIGHEDSVSFIRRYYMKDGTVGWNPGRLNPKILRPVGTIDPAIPIVAFETPQGKPLAAYVNFACHLDTTGGTKFSADYAYMLSQTLAAALDPDLVTVFTIGAAGNINHIDVNSPAPQTHSEAARIGAMLAADVLKSWKSLREIDAPSLRVSREMVPLPLADYDKSWVPKAKEIVANYGPKNANPFLDQVKAFKIMELEARDGRPIEAEVQTIVLGREIAWVSMPGEIFVDLGRAVKNGSPFPQTILAELAQDSINYVPDRKAYPQGAYEVVSTRVGPGAGEMMVQSAIKQLIEAYNK